MRIRNLSYAALVLSAITFTLAGCSRTPPSQQQQWQAFCKIYEGAAYNIMGDRQNDITVQQSIAHLDKLPAGIQRDMLEQLVRDAQKEKKYDQLSDKRDSMDRFKQGKYESCLAKQPKS